ncbi:hypothetical protein GCM10009733_059770 [Nonomuraea maheshkhaliensis]|uniref:Signal transduction histidine kinase subgroup 3 dimerisation and phosphoacceptor domain-containing protein n=1 Tax=Nonomuraea maheshkhaliensis TaxID=419590 RepID=A0ABN2FN10_9ACTN
MDSLSEPRAPHPMPYVLAEASQSPFDRSGLGARAAPFALVAVVAVATVVFPQGGVQSWPQVWASLALLAVTAGAFGLPWARLPSWLPVMVPLACTGSITMLILAAGPSSGVGIVLLMPLVWSMLFHRRWESACVVAAIVVAELVISLYQLAPASVTVRREVLWGALSALLAVAAHGLRERIRRSQEQALRLQDQLHQVTIAADRERIATGLADDVIQRVFAAGLSLQSAASVLPEGPSRHRLLEGLDELDEAVRLLGRTVFDLRAAAGPTLAEQIQSLGRHLSPPPRFTCTGPIDAAVPAGGSAALVTMLSRALEIISRSAAPTAISLSADQDLAITVTAPRTDAGATDADWPSRDLTQLRTDAERATATFDITTRPDNTTFTWHLSLARNGDPPAGS